MARQSSRRARLHDLFESDPRRAYSFAVLVDEYGHRFPGEPSGHGTLTAPLGALIHAGDVVREGRGRGMVRYRRSARPRQHQLDRQRLREEICRIVEQEHATTGAPVSTADVRRALQREGRWPDRFPRLVALLEAMAGESGPARANSTAEGAGVGALQRAPARRVRGRMPGFWLPGHAAPQCAVLAPTATEALRVAIATACAESGLPVSQQ